MVLPPNRPKIVVMPIKASIMNNNEQTREESVLARKYDIYYYFN
jgi:hypothetical protein